MAVLNKKEREVCWLSRDIFHQCLDRHRPEGETATPSRCDKLLQQYRLACPKQWVRLCFYNILLK